LNHYTGKGSIILDKPSSRARGMTDVYGFQIGFLNALQYDPTSDQNQMGLYQALTLKCPSISLPDFDEMMTTVGPRRLQELKDIKNQLNQEALAQPQPQPQYQLQYQPQVGSILQYTPNGIPGQYQVITNYDLNPVFGDDQEMQLAPVQDIVQLPHDEMDLFSVIESAIWNQAQVLLPGADLDSQDDLAVNDQGQAESAAEDLNDSFHELHEGEDEQEIQIDETFDFAKVLLKVIEHEEMPDLPVSELLKHGNEANLVNFVNDDMDNEVGNIWQYL
jgi:hypothetical protein